MPLFARLAALILAVVLVFAAAQFELFHSLDSRLGDMRFTATSRPASGDIVMVDIDAASLTEIGVWPWPRHLHARLLDRLLAMDAAEVVFDIDFSTVSEATDDQAFAAALERAGGYAYLAAFQQQARAGGGVITVMPLPRFRAFADPVSVNVVTNQWGDVTAIRHAIPTPTGPIPSVAAALAMQAPDPGRAVSIDYGIDLATIDRISAADILDGRADPARIAGRQVVIGASAIELHDLFQVPRFGRIPGAMVQAAASETLRAGPGLTTIGGWPIAIAAVFAAAAFLLLTAGLPLGLLLLAALTTMLAIEAVSYPALAFAHLLFPTAIFHVTIVTFAVFRLADALALRQTERRRQEKRLAFLAHHDVVTGALTRQSLVDDIDRLVAGAGGATLVAVEIERVGVVNKALGHQVGDRMLAGIAARLAAARPAALGRTGGSVFVLAFAGKMEKAELDEAVADLTFALEAPYHVDEHTALVSARFGTAIGDARESGAQLLRFADIALSHASGHGLRHVAFSPEMHAAIAERQVLDVAMRRSLANGDFFLLYQPQIDLASGAVIGVEALVRWRHPDLGIISPATFIPLAEETGAIVELGELILQRACREVAEWDWSGRLAVNVSAAQFRLGDVVATVRRALEVSGFPARRLDIEITESLLVDDIEAVLATLAALRGMGVGVAIDDFGTGYSSLSYLTRLPVDQLKIDQSFVRQLPGDGASATIVETIVSMAQRLGKVIVAEGIETAEQQDFLVALGCQVGQGYLYSKPLPLPDIRSRLACEAAPRRA